MIALLIFVVAQYLQSPAIPYRNKDDFHVELKYELRTRSASTPNSVDFDPTGPNKPKTGMLPYLIVSVTIMNVTPDEHRFKCEDNRGRIHFNKKLPKETIFLIDMGYIDDIKDQLAANAYELFALSTEKERLNRIYLRIEKDGTFLVNGEKRGKF
jgi:hypothetical protein